MSGLEIIEEETKALTGREVIGERVLDISNFNITGSIQNTACGTQYVGCNVNYYASTDCFPKKLPFYELPRLVGSFYGRDFELREIHRFLKESTTTVLSQTAAISGLGGVGKTTTAIAFAHKYKEEYKIILYIVGDSESSLQSEFYRIADELQIKIDFEQYEDGRKTTKPKTMTRIANEIYYLCSSFHTLIIFDNVEEQNHIVQYLPQRADQKLHILITSRKRNWKISLDFAIQTISLDIFTPTMSKDYIIDNLHKEYYSEKYIYDIENLAKRLNYIPLALSTAVNHIIKQNKTNTIDKYKVADLLIELQINADYFFDIEDKIGPYKFSVMTSLMITVNKLTEEAKTILEYMAYLKPDHIWINMFMEIKSKECKEAITLLADYSLINIENGRIMIHRLVQKMLRISLQQGGREEQVVEQILRLEMTNVHRSTVWKIACQYRNILTKYYSKHILSKIAGGINPDTETIKALVNFEYENGQYENIFECFALLLKGENLHVIKFLYDLLKKKCKHTFNLDELFFNSIGDIKKSEIIEFLISKGVNINYVDIWSRHTPIVSACKHGNVTAVKYLLSKACKAEIKKALLVACQTWNNDDVCEILIESFEKFELEFFLHIEVLERDTPIMNAFHIRNKKTVKLLVEYLKDSLKIPDVEGRTYFMYACYSNHIDIVKQAIEDMPVKYLNIRDKDGCSGLMRACEENNSDIVRLLINANVNLTLRDKNGRTALLYACRKNNKFIFEMLFQTGKYNVNDVDEDGNTPFIWACRNNWIDAVKAAIDDERFHVNFQNKKGESGFMLACFWCQIDVVRLLIAVEKINFTLRDNNGKNVLYYACEREGFTNEIISKILFNSGKYDLNEKYKNGVSFYEYGCKKGYFK